MTETPSPPLAGIRVLDLTRHMSGPYATVSLADYGADVIKIEGLPNGDDSRGTGVKVDGKVSATFLMWNRGKRSIALNLRNKESIEAIDALVKTADVLIENYRPGVIDKMGLSYERLKAINPGLIFVSLSAYGEGPLAPYPGTDPVVQAMSGIMSVTGEADGPPILVGIPVADFTAAMVTFQAVLLALIAREKTGRGQRVDVSMLHALMSSLTTRLAYYWAGREPKRNGGAHSVVMPYQVWQTSDGHVVAGVWNGGNVMWPRFCEALGAPHLAENPDYATNELRLKNKAQLEPLIQAEFVKKSNAEWADAFNSRGVLFSPVNTFRDVLEHEHVKQAGLVGSVHHPELGDIPQLTPPVVLHDTPGSLNRHPPLLGEHTVEILAEAGYLPERIHEMVERGVAGTPGAAQARAAQP